MKKKYVKCINTNFLTEHTNIQITVGKTYQFLYEERHAGGRLGYMIIDDRAVTVWGDKEQFSDVWEEGLDIKEERKVLDKGFVRLVDSMGTDSRIVQAARVSYGAGTKTVRQDEELIRYLFRHEHTSPFEMPILLFHCKMPIFVARQWIRHRTASLNEESGRYSIMKDEFYIPKNWRVQSKDNKQGSGEYFKDEVSQDMTDSYVDSCCDSIETYHEILSHGTAKEMARMGLPLSTYTSWYWEMDLKNLLHFLKLRLDSHAQYEIRVYAEAIAEIVKELFPMTWKAFNDYQLEAIKFSKQEVICLRELLFSNYNKAGESIVDRCITNKLEADEFRNKIVKIMESK